MKIPEITEEERVLFDDFDCVLQLAQDELNNIESDFESNSDEDIKRDLNDSMRSFKRVEKFVEKLRNAAI